MPKSQSHKPHFIDVAVGMNIKQRRRALKLSQESLAAAINLTFQQVQKYERGVNRVSASMLYEISHALKCDAADLLPRGKWHAETPASDWLEDARLLHAHHPNLFKALLKWPGDHLRLLVVTTQALTDGRETKKNS